MSKKNKNTKNRKKIVFEKKMREYRKFLKDDYEWDWHYIIRLLRYKLERTRSCIISNEIVANNKKVGREIQEVVTLLRRVEDDRYFDELHRPYHKKYGRPKMIKGKPDARGLIPVKFVYPKETKANRSQRLKDARRLSMLEPVLRKRDLERAFALMAENIWGWWD